jgi:hypothetical protein
VRQKLGVRARFDDPPRLDDVDRVGADDGRERCAIDSVVRPDAAASIASCTIRSDTVSSALVASSRSSTGGSLSSTRAIAMRCFSPPERR